MRCVQEHSTPRLKRRQTARPSRRVCVQASGLVGADPTPHHPGRGGANLGRDGARGTVAQAGRRVHIPHGRNRRPGPQRGDGRSAPCSAIRPASPCTQRPKRHSTHGTPPKPRRPRMACWPRSLACAVCPICIRSTPPETMPARSPRAHRHGRTPGPTYPVTIAAPGPASRGAVIVGEPQQPSLAHHCGAVD